MLLHRWAPLAYATTLATHKVDIRSIMIQSQSEQIEHQTLF
jgi:hypothetical protein